MNSTMYGTVHKKLKYCRFGTGTLNVHSRYACSLLEVCWSFAEGSLEVRSKYARGVPGGVV